MGFWSICDKFNVKNTQGSLAYIKLSDGVVTLHTKRGFCTGKMKDRDIYSLKQELHNKAHMLLHKSGTIFFPLDFKLIEKHRHVKVFYNGEYFHRFDQNDIRLSSIITPKPYIIEAMKVLCEKI